MPGLRSRPGDSRLTRLRRFVQRHERLLVGAYLGVLLGLGVLVAPGPLGRAVLGRAQGAMEDWSERWRLRVARGEEMLAEALRARREGRPLEAERRLRETETYLLALDEEFPARNVRHALDSERERLLRTLGETYLTMERKRDALLTFGRLADFDPRSYRNHHDLARAALHFGEEDAARDAFGAVLRVHPTHLPSVRGLVTLDFEAGRFDRIVATFERFLDALILSGITVESESGSATAYLPVDGRPHETELRLPVPPEGSLSIHTEGFALEVFGLTLHPPLETGRERTPALSVAGDAPEWRADGMRPLEDAPSLEYGREVWPSGDAPSGDGGSGVFGATAPHPVLRTAFPSPAGAVRVGLRARLLKLVDPDLWAMVRTAYRNLLDFEGLERAAARVAPCGPEAGAAFPCSAITWPGDI